MRRANKQLKEAACTQIIHAHLVKRLVTWPGAQLPANLLILRIGAPNLLAFIVCAWGIVGAATGMPLRVARLQLRWAAWMLASIAAQGCIQASSGAGLHDDT